MGEDRAPTTSAHRDAIPTCSIASCTTSRAMSAGPQAARPTIDVRQQETLCIQRRADRGRYRVAGSEPRRMKSTTRPSSDAITKPIPVFEIQPSGRALRTDLGDLWRYRELLYFLVWRDLKVRYRQTFIGAAWAVLQPLVAMVVFTIIFGGLVGVSSNGIPYPLFAFAALVPWTFFATGVAQASTSLVDNRNLLRKVYFPRLIIPLSAVSSGLANLSIAGLFFAAMMISQGLLPTAFVVWLIPPSGSRW